MCSLHTHTHTLVCVCVCVVSQFSLQRGCRVSDFPCKHAHLINECLHKYSRPVNTSTDERNSAQWHLARSTAGERGGKESSGAQGSGFRLNGIAHTRQ